jgi:hypothetical protein
MAVALKKYLISLKYFFVTVVCKAASIQQQSSNFKLCRSPEIDSKESIPPTIPGLLKSLKIRALALFCQDTPQQDYVVP